MNLGIDIGSVSIGTVLMNDRIVVKSDYVNHEGDVGGAIAKILEKYPLSEVKGVGITGRGHEEIGTLKRIDPIICFVEGTKYFYPLIRNIIFIGGESFGLIELTEEGDYKTHFVNTSCASGTGSFITQQAKRINLEPEELGRLAASFVGLTPQIATRCAVFAKSDIIHFQQEGFSIESISQGLCNGLARSILDTILSGRKIEGQTAVVGGVSRNAQVVKAIEEYLGMKIVIPDYSELIGAIGATLLADDLKTSSPSLLLDSFKKPKTQKQTATVRPPLELKLSKYPDFKFTDFYIDNATEVTLYRPLGEKTKYEVVMGIDVGSTTTKATLVDYNKEVLLSFYNRTSGDPIDAIKRIFRSITNFLEKRGVELEIKSVGTTGSGRKLVKEVIGADFQINEITAHAKAAVFIDPKVDTIIEIGGQDSKFTQIKNGAVYNSTLSYVCAAGTGSFIEEQAARLDVKIDDYADLAMGIEAPYTSDRCTVYMERDLSSLRSNGWEKRQLLAATLYSVRDNYISKVVNRAFIGNNVYFQGATGRNKALVAAFEELLKKPIHVSPYCHLTGALGVSLLLLEKQIQKTKFVGLNFANTETVTEVEVCELCNNNCRLTLFKSDSRRVAYGMMCGRDYSDKKPKKKEKKFFDVKKKYNEIFNAVPKNKITKPEKIGIPICLFMYEYQSLWREFFDLLGYEVVTSHSSRQAIDQGMACVTAEFCAPIVMSHGHIKDLLDKKVDYIFFPAMIKEKATTDKGELKLLSEKETDCYFCFYTEYLSHVFKSLPTFDIAHKIINPLIYFDSKSSEISKMLYESLKGKLNVKEREVRMAFTKAYDRFLKDRGELEKFGKEEVSKTKDNDDIAIAILGRPYNSLDNVINIDIPKKIVEMGYKVFLQDMLPTEEVDLDYNKQFSEKMHWNYGQKVMKAIEFVIKNDNIFPVYLTSFRCSPDSFLLEYFKEIMDRYSKPYLIIQLDAHGSDVGYITRIEAGIEAFKNWKKKGDVAKPIPYSPVRIRKGKNNKDTTILVPHVDEILYRFISAVYKACGYKSILLDENEATVSLGLRQASGGECLPILAMVGGAIAAVEKYNLDPDKTALRFSTACIGCNFSQFPILAGLIFKKLGWPNLKIFNVNLLRPDPYIPFSMSTVVWESHIIGGLLRKLYSKIKPYEINKGETDQVNKMAIEMIEQAILNKKSLEKIFKEVFSMFQSIKTQYTPKPKIALVGDLYVKYNPVMNQSLNKTMEDLGAELLITSTTEYMFFGRSLDRQMLKKHRRKFIKNIKATLEYKILKKIEDKFEKIVSPLLGDQEEPSIEELYEALSKYGMLKEVEGETALSLGRAIIFLEKGLADAIIHVNPIFCCPGIVSTAIFERIQKDYNVPVINIFYDGTGDHNKVLIPHLYYLNQKKSG